MGRAIGRIEKEIILNTILENNIPLTVHGNKKEFPGHMVSWEGKNLEVETESPLAIEIEEEEHLRLFFSYYGNTMTFESKVVVKENANGYMEIMKPAGIYRDLQRKYERVAPPSEVELQFTYESTKVVLDFPRTKEVVPLEEPPEDVDYDLSNLQNLINQFKEKAGKFAESHTITMFRGKKPESFEETVLVATAKPLFIPDTSDTFPDKNLELERPIVVKEDFPDPTHTDELFLGKHRQQLNAYLTQKNREGIKAEIYTPIIYQNYVAGYVKLGNSTKRDEGFTWRHLDFAVEFAVVLVYTLEKSGYFSVTEKEVGEYRPQLIDISASGLLFTHNSEALAENLGMYTDLELLLQVGHRKIRTNARVMRRYRDNDTNFYGLQFMEIQPEDFRFLFDFVYGRPFSEEDQYYWEGGAEPPKLDL